MKQVIEKIKTSFDIDDEEFAWECVETFYVTVSERSKKLSDAYARQDLKVILEEAHTIKSSSLVLDQVKLSELARKVEALLLNKEPVAGHYEAFKEELDLVLIKVKKMLDSK